MEENYRAGDRHLVWCARCNPDPFSFINFGIFLTPFIIVYCVEIGVVLGSASASLFTFFSCSENLNLGFNLPPVLTVSISDDLNKAQSNIVYKAARRVEEGVERWVTHMTFTQKTRVGIPCKNKHHRSFLQPEPALGTFMRSLIDY